MGQIDEEERPFMIVDKDTGRIYDIRNDAHVERLTGLATTTIQRNSINPALETKNDPNLRNWKEGAPRASKVVETWNWKIEVNIRRKRKISESLIEKLEQIKYWEEVLELSVKTYWKFIAGY